MDKKDTKLLTKRTPKTVPASKVGLSLTISKETLEEFDRINLEHHKARLEAGRYLLR